MSLTDNIDTSTPGGRSSFHIMASLAEMEREPIVERTRAGLAAAPHLHQPGDGSHSPYRCDSGAGYEVNDVTWSMPRRGPDGKIDVPMCDRPGGLVDVNELNRN